MRIGELAKRGKVRIDTVRYYEREGLLFPAGRQLSGYRQYGDAELKRLRFIRRAKDLGFNLKEIRGLLTLRSDQDIARVKQAAQARLADIDRRIAELNFIRGGLHSLIEACPGHGRAEAGPFLNALNLESGS